jgi:hypothetical protein
MEKLGECGTINIMLVLDCDLPAGALTRALVTCTEAKTAAIQELLAGSNYSNGLATGSGTDQTIIVANPERDLYFETTGKHSKIGEMIGKVVIKAVKRALEKQAGLNAQFQHNVFRRLKRFGVLPGTMWSEYQEATNAEVKPVYLLAAENLAKDKMMLTYTSLYIHLLDQFLWQLVSAEEMQAAGQSLLDTIASYYNVESEQIPEASLEGMLASWKVLFNKIVATKSE